MFASCISLRAQSFTNPRRLPTATTPTQVLVGDLNNDGRLDLVYVLSQPPTNRIHPLLAASDGSYAEAPTITVQNTSSRCLLFDLNHDGLLDLTCGTDGTLSQSVVTLLGHGDGTFGQPVFSPVPPAYGHPFVLRALAMADFNHDGYPDLVLGVPNGSPQVILMFGNGTGSFTPGTTTTTGSPAATATVADLNGDGNPDLYLRSLAGNSAIILLGHPDGTFANPSSTINGILYDVDGDGHLDLIGGDTSLLIYRGNADGTFNSATPLVDQSFPTDNVTNFRVADYAGPLACQDVNGDGIADVLADSGDGVTVLLGGPGLRFTPASHAPIGQDLLAGPFFANAVSIDLDGDGNLDFVTAGPQGVYITYGRANGTFASAVVYESGTNVTNGVVADFNGDGFPDVVTTGDLQLNLSLGLGNGTFRPSQPISGTTIFPSGYQRPLAGSIVHGDFNGDGHQDLLVTASTDFYGQQPDLFLGRGDGTFAAPILAPAAATYILQTSVADFNNDGRTDFAIATNIPYTPPVLTTYSGQPNGTFVPATTAYPGGFYRFADMDGDGRLDLISFMNQTITIMPGRGDGTFAPATARVALPATLDASDLAIGDFDGDGKPDLALLTLPVGTSSIFDVTAVTRFYNDGYPAFSAAISSPIGPRYINRLLAADLNEDGLQDLIYDNGTSLYTLGAGPGITFVTSNAARTVSAESTIIAGNTLLFLTAIDLNGDGRLDLLAGNGDSNRRANSFAVLLNQGNTPQATGTLTANPEPSRLQAAFQLTATLAPPPANGGAILSGSITFSIDGTVLASAPLVANTATLVGPTTLTRGVHTLTATWPGQLAFGTTPALAALTLSATHTVTGQPSTTTLTASATPVPAGTPITFTAATTVQGGTAPDLSKLQIVEGTTPLTPASTTSANSITAITTLVPGTHTLTAIFAGDTNAEPSTSAPVTVVVAAAPTTLTLSSPGGVAFQNTPVLGTAQFNPAPATPPGGTVTFTVNGQPLATAALSSQNTATVNLNQRAGTYALHAVYAPGTTAVSTAFADATLTITRAPVSLAFTSPLLPAPTSQSKPITLTATLDDLTTRHLATGILLPTIDGVPQTPLPLPASPAFSYTATGLAPGTHTVTLTYPGDANFLPATTATANLTVLRRDFALSGDPTLTIPTQHYRGMPVTLTSIGDFAGPVALSCANLPPSASCRFSQTPANVTAGNATTFQLTVDTSALPGYLAADRRTGTERILAATLAPLGLVTLLFARRRPAARLLLILLLTAATITGLIGCSGQYPAFTPPGTYTIQVIGQSTGTGGTTAALTHSQPLTLIVTP